MKLRLKTETENCYFMFKPSPKSFKNTFCVFHEVTLSEIETLQVSYNSEAGSTYYYVEKGMFRLSNHWGRLANSKWRLVANESISDSKFKLGFATWNSFFPDNNDEKLYFLEYDSDTKTINYQHKNAKHFDGKAILRTTFETAKRIKQARNILTLSSWAKYYETDIVQLRAEIIHELIFTEKTLDQIKRNLS
jgi:hypothetical protein